MHDVVILSKNDCQLAKDVMNTNLVNLKYQRPIFSHLGLPRSPTDMQGSLFDHCESSFCLCSSYQMS